MAGMRCPHCGRNIGVPDYVLRADVYCPKCHQTFQSETIALAVVQQRLGRGGLRLPGSPAVLEVPALPAQAAAATDAPASPQQPAYIQLVTPQRCHQCKGDLTTPIGRARTTIDCPLCQRRTSVYALLFHCPHGCRALLEAPLSRQGEPAACPGCARSIVIPSEIIFTDPEEVGDSSFSFRCRACKAWLAAGKEHAGSDGVCPQCLTVMPVPHGGYSASVSRAAAPGKEIRCRICQTKIPAQVAVCPRCRHVVPAANEDLAM